jgi:Fe-S-cluster containining protein
VEQVRVIQTIRDVRISTKCEDCTNKCCSQPYDWVYLTAAELSALANASGKDSAEFSASRTNEATGARFRVLNLPCAFLDQKSGQCTVYYARPLVCRLFPFYPDPVTGHATLLPAQCGSNLLFHASDATAGWQLRDYDLQARQWLQELWSEATERIQKRDDGSKTPTDGSP